MTSADAPQVLLQLAGVGMVANFICTAVLRRNLAADSDLAGELFAKPFSGGGARYLNARYFFPWVKSPEYLAEESWSLQSLFWVARLGGTVMALGLVGFLASVIYLGTVGQS